MNKTCALAMEKACLAYVSEIMDELERRGVMTSESLEAASAVLNEMRVTTGKPKKAKAAKVKKAVVETPAHLIPFCGTVNDKWCCGARVNHGLYTQCTKGREEGEDYCKLCQKQSDNSASGKPNGGDIRERVAQGAEWRDSKGKSPISFATLLAKPKFSALTMESAETECARFGWTIPESERVTSATKRGRPKKVVEVSDTDSEDGEKPKPKRGRPKKQPAKKQELSDLIKQQALAAVAELSDSDTDLPVANVEAKADAKPKAKKVKKTKAPKQPSQKALKAQAFREKLVKEINEVDSTISYEVEIFNQSNAELRTFLKEAKVAKKAKDKQAKKEAVEKLKADKAAAKELEKAAKKEAADKVKAEKKAAKKEAADTLKAEKKAAKELEKAEKEASKEVEKAKKLAAVKAKIAAIEAPQLEEEDENIVLGELTLDKDEVAVEQAMPFNITTGKCFKGEDAEYFAMCDDTSFPEAKPDEEGDICLYNAEGEMVATYEDGVVVPLDYEE